MSVYTIHEFTTFFSGSRHGFPSEVEEILSAFKDLSAEEKSALTVDQVVNAMESKGYSNSFASVSVGGGKMAEMHRQLDF